MRTRKTVLKPVQGSAVAAAVGRGVGLAGLLAFSCAANALNVGVGNTQTYTLSGGLLNEVSESIGMGGLTAGGQGTFNHTGGTNTVQSLGVGFGSTKTNGYGHYNLTGGALHAVSVSIGGNGTNDPLGGTGYGSFSQTAGTQATIDYLYVGKGAGLKNYGVYGLSSGFLDTRYVHVGAWGSEGVFQQSGGLHTVTSELAVGEGQGVGRYDLFGGDLITEGSARVGARKAVNVWETTGSGAFVHTGGTFQARSGLVVGFDSGTSGSYSLSSKGNLITNLLSVGMFGVGSFSQSGGTNTISGKLEVGANSATGRGNYVLSGGALSALSQFIGSNNGVSEFTQKGGTNTVTSGLVVGSLGGSGSYMLTGGTLGTASEQIGRFGSIGTFTQTGGTHTITGDLTMGTKQNGSTLLGNGTFNLRGGVLNVGRIMNGEGTSTFNLDGGTLNLTGNSIDVDTFTVGAKPGYGANFTLDAGKTLIATNVIVGKQGILAVNGVLNGATFVDGGVLMGAGTFNGSVTVGSAGALKPGNSPGTMTIEGDLHLMADSVLELQVYADSGGNPVFDRLVIGGNYVLDPGSTVRFDFGTTGFSGDSFLAIAEGDVPLFSLGDFFQYADGRLLEYSTFQGVQFTGLKTAAGLNLIGVTTTGEFIATSVPEPATYATFLAGLGLLSGLALRRRAGQEAIL